MEFVRFYKYNTIAEALMAYLLRMMRYLGITEGSAEHRQILRDYNTLAGTSLGLPRGHEAVASDDWCAIFAAGQAHAAGLTYAYPMECSCSKIIEIAKTMGIWIEDDGYIPAPGDWVLYAWKGLADAENTLAPNHIGTIYHSDGEIMLVVEGNKSDAVGVRAMAVGDKRIRGFVHPDLSGLIGDVIAPPAVQEPVQAGGAIYHRVEDVPEFARPTVAKLVERGLLLGIDAGDLGLSEELIRTLTILDRAGAFEPGTAAS